MSAEKIGRICYSCLKPVGEDNAKFCPVCGYNFVNGMAKYANALPQGTVLAGKYVTGPVFRQDKLGITYYAKELEYSDGSLLITEYFPDAISSRLSSARIAPYTGERAQLFDEGKAAFLNMIKTVAMFNANNNVVCVYNYFEDNGTVYSVMQYITGKTLKEYVRDKGGKISWTEAQNLLNPIMDALAGIHSYGIIHGDINPDSIIIDPDGTPKLVNFSSVRFGLGAKMNVLDKMIVRGYTPVELYPGGGRQSAATDVYGLGAVFYFAVTGTAPPDAKDRSEKDTFVRAGATGITVSPPKDQALTKALAVNPLDRFKNVKALKEALSGKVPSESEVPEIRDPLSRSDGKDRKKQQPKSASKGRERKPVPGGLIAVIVVLVILGGLALISVPPEKDQIKTKNTTSTDANAMVKNAAVPETDETTPSESDEPQAADAADAGTTAKKLVTTKKTAAETDAPGEPDEPEETDGADTDEDTDGISPEEYDETSPEEYDEDSGETGESTGETTRPVQDEQLVITAPAITTARQTSPSSAVTAGTASTTRKPASATTKAKPKVTTAATTRKSASTTKKAATTSATTAATTARKDTVKYTDEKFFQYKEENGGITITAYTGKDKNVVIPKTIKGKQVLKLKGTVEKFSDGELDTFGSSGIFDPGIVDSLTLPEGLKEISDFALANLKLTSVTIPNGVHTIGTGAFFGSAIKNIKLPAGVTYIGESAFGSCKSLTEIDIVNSVSSIGDGAFEQCDKLTAVTLRTGLAKIGEHAFRSCTKLKSITIPNTVTSVGSGAFYLCESLKTAVISSGQKTLSSYLFSYCTSLSDVTIPEGVTSLSPYCFEYCTGLNSVKLPTTVTYIDKDAFSGCSDISVIKR